MKKFKLAVILFLFAAFNSACTKDKTMSEYQREKLQENLALYQSVAGSYTGLVNSQQDGRIIGAMQIDLRAETIVDSSNSGDSALGTPVLVSNIRFLDENVVSLSAASSFYDLRTGAYSTHVVVTRSSGKSEQIMVRGNLGGGVLHGEIASLNYPNYGGQFILERGGKDIHDLIKNIPNSPEKRRGGRQTSAYVGMTEFTSGISKPVQIVMIQPLRGTSEDFLDLMSPIKSVQVNFNYTESMNILFDETVFDVQQGFLTGQSALTQNGQNKQMRLECLIYDSIKLNCKHITPDVGIAAITEAVLNSQNLPLPADDISDRQSITKRFVGRSQIGDDYRRIIMSATLPVRDRLTELLDLFFPVNERTLHATINFSESVSVSFVNLKWDGINGLLDGSEGELDRRIYYQCHDFYFVKTKFPFKCNYWTSRSPTIQIEFSSLFKE